MFSIHFVNDFEKKIALRLNDLEKKTALPHAGKFPEQSGRVPKGIFAV
jgi:hypothetical protein